MIAVFLVQSYLPTHMTAKLSVIVDFMKRSEMNCFRLFSVRGLQENPFLQKKVIHDCQIWWLWRPIDGTTRTAPPPPAVGLTISPKVSKSTQFFWKKIPLASNFDPFTKKLSNLTQNVWIKNSFNRLLPSVKKLSTFYWFRNILERG